MTPAVLGPLVVGAAAACAVLLWSGPGRTARVRSILGRGVDLGTVWPGRSRGRRPSGDRGGVAAQIRRLAALVSAGLTPAQAWARLAQAAEDPDTCAIARRCALAAERGDDVAAAIREEADGWARGRGRGRRSRAEARRRAWHGLAAAWSVSVRGGAPLSRMLDRFAAAVQGEEDLAGARDAVLAGPRATVATLSWLPLGGVALGTLVGGDPLGVLLGPGPGRWCLVGGAGLIAVGRIWIARAVARAAS